VQSRREKLAVRAATLGVIAAGCVLAALMHTPASLPSTAFGSALLLFCERVVLVVAGLLFLLVVAYRGWRGELPLKLSERGAEWEPMVQQGDSLLSELAAIEEQLDALRNEFDVLASKVGVSFPERRLK
jgi:hypothetical protein